MDRIHDRLSSNVHRLNNSHVMCRFESCTARKCLVSLDYNEAARTDLKQPEDSHWLLSDNLRILNCEITCSVPSHLDHLIFLKLYNRFSREFP